MKAILDIPESLYRQVETRSAREGRTVREVTIGLYERWLDAHISSQKDSGSADWLESLFALADEAIRKAPGGPTAREILEDDRNRLESR